MTDHPTPAAEPKPVRRMLQPTKKALRLRIEQQDEEYVRLVEQSDRLFIDNARLLKELAEAKAHPLRLWWRRVMRRAK